MYEQDTNPMHPGHVLLDQFLLPHRETISRLARQMKVPQGMLQRVVKGESPVSRALAHKLAQHYGQPVDFWLRLQVRYDQ
ncbi:MAG: HigA family addiction module antidote protein [Desulfarculaceae bacterium]|nr:HigA family addiction module antidote protein [Desulfarculaceae bacterium]MCF8047610.1 HigA family addiction module antidote protein [Desulfarculaceae bacterium]MCF8066531.1 HigA family addiction module antidote protein [Desulfarculaceae bacterium]MCF8098384.1 HigA family addiction module antidote protein [Desulfarculaceae bacterium]MCF8123917.1 HigA family addiction module antidote protein [Desulfarculaceae bacterium]